DDRLRQPWPHIGLAPRPRRFEMIEAKARDHPRKVGARIGNVAASRSVPAQIGVLDDVLGLGERAEHAIGESGQMPPVRLEFARCSVLGRHAACLTIFMGAPPTVTRRQACPWPSAYLTVGNMRAAVIAKAMDTSACRPQRRTICSRSSSAAGSCAMTALVK